MSKTELKPSAETDLRVAKACGWDRSGFPEILCFKPDKTRFQPSSNWDDARYAAVESGLFMRFALNVYADTCVICLCGDSKQVIASNPSGPLAICAAILKLEEETK